MLASREAFPANLEAPTPIDCNPVQPALLNASYGLSLPRITSPRELWHFFLGELRQEMSRMVHAQRLAGVCQGRLIMTRMTHCAMHQPNTGRPYWPRTCPLRECHLLPGSC